MSASPKEDDRPARFGWAPGRYHNRCHKCDERFTGDKRSVTCADCAYAQRGAYDQPDTLSTADVNLRNQFNCPRCFRPAKFRFDTELTNDSEFKASQTFELERHDCGHCNLIFYVDRNHEAGKS